MILKSDRLIQSGISPKIGKIAYELLYRDSSKYTIICLITISNVYGSSFKYY